MTEETTPKETLLGIPIEGDIQPSTQWVDQRPLEEFQPLIRRLLEDERILDFGWTQYTPFFNDGEPCEFSARAPWVRTTEEEHLDPDEVDLTCDESSLHPTLGGRDWDTESRKLVTVRGQHPDLSAAVQELRAALEGGSFDRVLMEKFGDHCQVTVRKDRISVDSYDHG